MADVAIKPEIKLDPAEPGAKLTDVEEFEEDTTLQFPDTDRQAWFARIPAELWQAWHQIYLSAPENSSLEVAKMRVYDNDEHSDQLNQKIEIMLHSDVKETRQLPQKYSLKIQTKEYNNTVVFSEKDLPGHSSKSFGRGRFLSNAKSNGINKNERYGKKSGYASAIPKQTALAQRIQHEAVVNPEVDPEVFFQGLADSMKTPASALTTFVDGRDARNIQPSRNGAVFSSFTTTSKPLRGKKKVPKDKAVRMSQEELYDAIYRCFKRYKYWRLGAFRRELNQSEAYLKSTLEPIANLVRSGDFAGCYMLKPEFAQMQNIDQSRVKEESANIESAAEDGTDGGTGDELDDDDDLVEMEDVKMENT